MMNPSPINILYVDDELNNLLSFKALFRLKYNLYLAQNINETAAILENNTIHILLTDQKMPAITGLEFVEIIENKYPDLVCVLITGYAPERDVNRAINSGKLYACLAKPWDEAQLDEIVQEAYVIYNKRKLARNNAATVAQGYGTSA